MAKKEKFLCPHCNESLLEGGLKQECVSSNLYHCTVNEKTGEIDEFDLDEFISGSDDRFYCTNCDKDISYEDLEKVGIKY